MGRSLMAAAASEGPRTKWRVGSITHVWYCVGHIDRLCGGPTRNRPDGRSILNAEWSVNYRPFDQFSAIPSASCSKLAANPSRD